MKIALICFTARGYETERRAAAFLKDEGHEVCAFLKGRYAEEAADIDGTIPEPTADGVSDSWNRAAGVVPDSGYPVTTVPEGGLVSWAGERFADSQAILFIGACGIAVRAAAPFVRDKFTDPAVLVIDETARFVIPLLSGHVGGANELALRLAGVLSAEAVITTATDRNGVFAVDTFAAKRGLMIADRLLAKRVSAALLAGEPVGFFSDFPIDEEKISGASRLGGLRFGQVCGINIRITAEDSACMENGDEENAVLRLIPRCTAVGLGCRRGTDAETIRQVFSEALRRHHIDIRSVFSLASIDLKKEESGLLELAASLSVPFQTKNAGELLAVPGEYSDSDFVRQTTGVGNVCERAAMAACLERKADAKLLFPKYARGGVTVAAACFMPAL